MKRIRFTQIPFISEANKLLSSEPILVVPYIFSLLSSGIIMTLFVNDTALSITLIIITVIIAFFEQFFKSLTIIGAQSVERENVWHLTATIPLALQAFFRVILGMMPFLPFLLLGLLYLKDTPEHQTVSGFIFSILILLFVLLFAVMWLFYPIIIIVESPSFKASFQQFRYFVFTFFRQNILFLGVVFGLQMGMTIIAMYMSSIPGIGMALSSVLYGIGHCFITLCTYTYYQYLMQNHDAPN